MWVPCAPNLAAVDVILELERSHVWGIHIHVSAHKDVSAKFAEMCQNAGWFASRSCNVHLLCLSPTPTIKEEIETRLRPGSPIGRETKTMKVTKYELSTIYGKSLNL